MRDRGSTTIGIALLLAAVTVAVALAVGTGIVRDRATAAQAADAAALAAADVLRGISPGLPCAIADRVATTNGARLQSCRIQDFDVLVEVAVPAWHGLAEARSRAGPPMQEGDR